MLISHHWLAKSPISPTKLDIKEGKKEGNVLFNNALNTFIFIYMVLNIWLRKEGNVLFNDTLNTFYLWLYGF